MPVLGLLQYASLLSQCNARRASILLVSHLLSREARDSLLYSLHFLPNMIDGWPGTFIVVGTEGLFDVEKPL